MYSAHDTPKYKKASFSGEYVSLKNDCMEFVLYKRLSGWGFGEIYNGNGRLMGVLDNLGELLVRDQELPMRLEAEAYTLSKLENGDQELSLNVKSMNVQKKLDGTSFSNWMRYPFQENCIEGRVTLTLKNASPVIHIKHELEAKQNLYVKYLRGVWLKVGEASFGAAKDDAILPGVEWLCGNEWSSGNDWFREPWYNKFAPVPNKVAIPCMTLSNGGDAIGLSWDPVKWATRWFNYRKHFAQPVFAVPNFIDRSDNSIFGLMVPSATDENNENQVYAEPPLEMHYGQMVRFDSEIFVCKGNSLDALCAYVSDKGLPDALDGVKNSITNGIASSVTDKQCIREHFNGILDKIASHYASNLWKDGEGFGNDQQGYGRGVPAFLQRYINENENSSDEAIRENVRILKERIEWCRQSTALQKAAERSASAASDSTASAAAASDSAATAAAASAIYKRKEKAYKLMSYQKNDGSFTFDPDGRHKSKDDFVVARDFAEPMGQSGDTALSMCASAALELIDTAAALPDGEDKTAILSSAERALEFCMPMTRPEGGDYWETPLHAPNLLAAGQAACAFYEAYRIMKREDFRQKAVYWIRSVIPFTHLWEPENIHMLYNTKPCLCSSDWYFANWVRDHVQWEVLQVFNTSCARKIDWQKEDPEINWRRFHMGITLAAARWIVDHRLENWMPHNKPETYAPYMRGNFDGCFPDTFNSVTGNYGGMVIMPDTIASNIYYILDMMHES